MAVRSSTDAAGGRPLRIALLYGVVAFAWILASDLALSVAFDGSVAALTVWQSVKGLAFAAASAGLIYVTLRHALRRLRAAHDAATASERRLRDFANLVPDWFWETDLEQRFTLLHGRPSPNGEPPERALGRSRRDLIAAEGGNPAVCDIVADYMQRGEPLPGIVYSIVEPDGGRRWEQIFGQPARDGAGRIVGYRGVGCDITERKRTEAVLQGAFSAAEAASRSKDAFLANLHHELRTPLNAILGFSQLMSSGAFGPIAQPQYQSYLRDIQDSAQRLLEMINNLLDYAALQDGRIVLRDESVVLDEVIESVILMVRERADAARITLSRSVPDSLPHLRADKHRLQQILLALLLNAIKFTPPGGHVTVEAGWEEKGVILIVHDTGIGMDEHEISHALSVFGQVEDRLVRKYEGIGLGLPLAKALVELHKGRLTVRSESGKGTDVEIVLPRERIVA